MIELYYWPTPNGWKISIALEELGLRYVVKPVNLGRGEQFAPEFLTISPNNRIPALVDHDPPGGGPPFSSFESGAMLMYLADKTGRLLPADWRGRHNVLPWLAWQVAELGPMLSCWSAMNFLAAAPDRPAALLILAASAAGTPAALRSVAMVAAERSFMS